MTPLYGFLEGDTMGLLILARDDMTVGEVAWNLCVSAQLRVEIPEGEAIEVRARGQVLDLGARVCDLGLQPLERVDVRTTRRGMQRGEQRGGAGPGPGA